MAHQKRLNVYVYGSCVSRDTVAAMDPETASIAGYTARHSILSEGTDASYKLPDDLGLKSAFQTRMVRQDWAGNALEQLFAHAPDIDLLLWDLTDERHGVHWFVTGEVITRSVDLLRSQPALDLIEPNTRIGFGNDLHFDGWADKTTEFVSRLRDAGLLEKTRLIKINWATKTTTGEDAPYSMALTPNSANKLYQRYYQHLENLGVPVIEVPQELALADPEHIWGAAPFHYGPATYRYIIEAIHHTITPQQETNTAVLTHSELTALAGLLDVTTKDHLRTALRDSLAASLGEILPDGDSNPTTYPKATAEALWITHMLSEALTDVNWANVWLYHGTLPVFQFRWNGKIVAIDVRLTRDHDSYYLNIKSFIRGGNIATDAPDIFPATFIATHTEADTTDLIYEDEAPSLLEAYDKALSFMQEFTGYFEGQIG
ncbi:DUF6270 domain-containing protein [Rothia nasimurium]|uniref:DUF6270 domain-containing protein n=1 Tax=Rothia nasimurium TaxID=85336 RepID=UPI001F3B23B0|nr:DUF6270 domain-containing protein [Rothia nasimurium]